MKTVRSNVPFCGFSAAGVKEDLYSVIEPRIVVISILNLKSSIPEHFSSVSSSPYSPSWRHIPLCLIAHKF